MPKREWIPFSVRREVTSSPCAVCGIPFDLHCDHIVSVAAGGSSARSNLQSLCSACNHIKHAGKTNADVSALVYRRGVDHFIRAVWRNDTKFDDVFGGPDIARWAIERPDRAAYARELHKAFVMLHSERIANAKQAGSE